MALREAQHANTPGEPFADNEFAAPAESNLRRLGLERRRHQGGLSNVYGSTSLSEDLVYHAPASDAVLGGSSFEDAPSAYHHQLGFLIELIDSWADWRTSGCESFSACSRAVITFEASDPIAPNAFAASDLSL